MHPLRTIDDAREIVAATLNARRAVVLGAGVLGLEAACGLAARGVAVTVVHPAAALMERQLDSDASRVVESAMGSLGIDHRVGVGAEEVLLQDNTIRGVRLTDGEVLDAELLVLATGTMANTGLAVRAGLSTERGVLVSADLASVDDRRVFAIGDCAQPPEGGTGLVAQGWEQSRRLAATLTGPPPRRAPQREPATGSDVVRLKADGLDVVTMGVCGSTRADNPAQRQIRLSDPAAGRHVELVVSEGVLVGATCVGVGSVGADLVAAYTRRTPVPTDPAYLLLPALAGVSTQAAPSPRTSPTGRRSAGATACPREPSSSNGNTGCPSVEEVAAATRATTGCGGCREEVCGLLDWLGATSPAAGAGARTFYQRETQHPQRRNHRWLASWTWPRPPRPGSSWSSAAAWSPTASSTPCAPATRPASGPSPSSARSRVRPTTASR